MIDPQRAHGVTPGLRQDYPKRVAGHQAAFLLPLLEPGMKLVDIGCGPGTITLGLARAVAPGAVNGIDHDPVYVQAAYSLASDRGQRQVKFECASALALPFADNTFDVAFENDMLIHLADQAVDAAAEAYRVTKPGGIYAARDADAGLAIWGHPEDDLRFIDQLMIRWQASRGSDIRLGSRLPEILRRAGFDAIHKSVSADTKGDPASVRAHAEVTCSLLDGPLGHTAIENGWADPYGIDRLKDSVRSWAEHPDAFFANVHIEVIGRKPAQVPPISHRTPRFEPKRPASSATGAD